MLYSKLKVNCYLFGAKMNASRCFREFYAMLS
jgi:hypothetical protein